MRYLRSSAPGLLHCFDPIFGRNLRRRFPDVKVLMMSGGGSVVPGDFLPHAVALAPANHV